MVWKYRPCGFVNIGAITFTSCARFAIFTTSAWRKNAFRKTPMASASSKL